MSGIVGSYFNTRGSGIVAKLGTDGHVFTSTGAGLKQGFEAAAGGGKIGQIVSTTKTDIATYATQDWADIPDMTLDITPVATSSKILLMTDLCTSVTSGYDAGFRCMRDSTVIYIGDSESPRYQASKSSSGHYNQQTVGYSAMFVDSPSSTSAITYHLEWFVENTATVYIGRAVSFPSAVYYGTTANTILAMEILA